MAKLIMALDKVANIEQIRNIYADTCAYVDGYKITAVSLLNGWADAFVEAVQYDDNKDILLDLKLADVGVWSQSGPKWVGTNSEIIRAAKDFGATHITVHGFPGEDSVQEALETANQCGLKTMLLATMTHKGAEQYMDNEYVEQIILWGDHYNTYGYIGPGNDYDYIAYMRNMTGKPFWSPGFGRQVTLRGGEELDIYEQIFRWRKAVRATNEDAIIVGSLLMKNPKMSKTIKEALTK